jgi:hypothetical protein
LTNEAWNEIFEKLRGSLKQGFEQVVEMGVPIVDAQMARVNMMVGPGMEVQVGIFFFIALEGPAAVLRKTAEGLSEAQAISMKQYEQVSAAQPRIHKPS